jgi:hypothetical protein
MAVGGRLFRQIRDVASEGYPKRLTFDPFLFWRSGQLLDDLKSLGYNVP